MKANKFNIISNEHSGVAHVQQKFTDRNGLAHVEQFSPHQAINIQNTKIQP
jgi:hypothetical protein